MKTLSYWNSETFDIATYKWTLEGRKNKKVNSNGSDNSGCVYTFNEYGFRGDSPEKEGIKILSVGCSHTEGIGVNDNETWSHYLSRMIPTGVDINLGISGRSNDYISRTIITFLDIYKPDLVLIMYTYPERREYYTKNGKVEPYHINCWGYFDEDIQGKVDYETLTLLSNEHENYINWYKNHLLISNFLTVKKIPYIWNGTFLNTTYKDENRFDGNYPNIPDNHRHASPLENQKYAKELYTYIKNQQIL